MGSYCELTFDSISIISQKSYVPDELVSLFQESDRRETGSGADDEDFAIRYEADRSTILARLDICGITSDAVRNAFDAWLKDQRETYKEYLADGDWAADTAACLAAFSFEEWAGRVPEVLRTRYDFDRPDRDTFTDEIDRRLRDLQESWLFFDEVNCLNPIRAMLELLPEVDKVALDLTSLVLGGYIGQAEQICDERRRQKTRERSGLESTVIIAEGSTDILVLKHSIQKLYPYLADYFTFFDHNGMSVDGGAEFLLKFIRALPTALETID